MEKIRVGLVQINNGFSGQNYFPYSVGILQAYAQKNLKNPGSYKFLPPVYARIPIDQAVEQLIQADMIGFSLYVWNAQISLRIAQELKKRKPEIVIFFGGPHVPDRVEDFLRQHRFIDLACHGEGEQVFTSVLENGLLGAWDKIPSISFLKKEGTLVQTPRVQRMRDLSSVPSPYLEGVFDPLMKANPHEHWITVWETNRGCPFSCTFCDWGSATASKVNSWEMERIFKEIDWFADHKIEFVFCADANFGILPRDIEIARYAAETKKKRGYPQAMSLQNTKNATERSYQVQWILHEAGLNKGVVLSLQSVDQGTLKAIKRDNISLETYNELQRRFAAQGVETMSDLILGLPGETYDSFAEGVSTIIENGQHNRIQFNNLSILPNAEMGDPEYQKRYGMEIVETKVVNVHGKQVGSPQEVYETQQLVIATNTMPKPDWVRTRAFAWMAGFLHFDKVLQIPMVVLRQQTDISYRDLIEFFSEGHYNRVSGSDPTLFPVLNEVHEFFFNKAQEIQRGGPEYVYSEEWLKIYWPADEYVLIRLCVEEKLKNFYQEVQKALKLLVQSKGISIEDDILSDVITLNKNLIKIPFQTQDKDIELSYNIWEFYQSTIRGKLVLLEKKPHRCHINRISERWDSWDDWLQKVIWWSNKKGAYLYGNISVGLEK